MMEKNKDIHYYRAKVWRIFGYTLGGILVFFLLAAWGIFGHMPDFEELENPNSSLATEVISSDGVTIGKFYNENRTSIKYQDLPKHLVDALISTEDERFYEHSGIDFRRTTTAMLSLGTRGGASTITQQLSKLLFHGEGSHFLPLRLVQKVKEWIIATRLERQYTKNEIIAMYLNKADFVNTAVGIRSAAKVYFGKEPKDLTIDESAMLVGMLNNPSLFNPIRRPQRTLSRRNIVLKQMARNHFITEAQKEELQKKPIVLHFQPESHDAGTATYFREYLREYFMKEWCRAHINPETKKPYNIYQDGLRIYTTVDSRMQRYAEEAVDEHMHQLQDLFIKDCKRKKNAPFAWNVSKAEIEKIRILRDGTPEQILAINAGFSPAVANVLVEQAKAKAAEGTDRLALMREMIQQAQEGRVASEAQARHMFDSGMQGATGVAQGVGAAVSGMAAPAMGEMNATTAECPGCHRTIPITDRHCRYCGRQMRQ